MRVSVSVFFFVFQNKIVGLSKKKKKKEKEKEKRSVMAYNNNGKFLFGKKYSILFVFHFIFVSF